MYVMPACIVATLTECGPWMGILTFIHNKIIKLATNAAYEEKIIVQPGSLFPSHYKSQSDVHTSQRLAIF